MKAWTSEQFQRLCDILDRERRKRRLPPAEGMERRAVGLVARMWKRSEQKGECIEWTGSGNRYGHIVFTTQKQRRCALSVHRVAFWLYRGDPGRKNICHSCDNPRCFNPEHLWAGSQSQNMIDCVSKGRHGKPRGARHPHATLTPENVIAIRCLNRLERKGSKRIARLMGLSTSAVEHVIRRRTWKWLDARTLERVRD